MTEHSCGNDNYSPKEKVTTFSDLQAQNQQSFDVWNNPQSYAPTVAAWRKGFHRLCADGHIEGIKKCLDDGQDVNEIHLSTREDRLFCMAFNETPYNRMAGVHIAMMTRNLPLLKLLDDYGADPYLNVAPSPSGFLKKIDTPVEVGILSGFLEGLKFYADERGYRLHLEGLSSKEHMLALAFTKKGTPELLDFLFHHLDIEDFDYTASLHKDLLYISEGACPYPQLLSVPVSLTEFLLKKNYNLNYEPSPRMDSSKSVSSINEALTDTSMSPFQAEICLRNLYDTLPLIRVAYKGDVERVRLYLKYGANPLQRDRNGNTALDAVSETSPKNEDLNNGRQKIISALRESIERRTPGVQPLVPRKQTFAFNNG